MTNDLSSLQLDSLTIPGNKATTMQFYVQGTLFASGLGNALPPRTKFSVVETLDQLID